MMGPSKGKNIKNTSHEVTKRKIRIRQLSLAKEAREKEKMICVNHVMSNDVYSGIFESILNYFQRLSPPYIKYHVSIKPLKGMHIYHYHRPHIEEKLKPYSIATVHHDLRDSDKWLNNEKFIDRYAESKKVICLNSLQERILHREGINHTVVIPHGYRPDIFALDDVSAKENKKKQLSVFFLSVMEEK